MPCSLVTMSRLGWMTKALISLFCSAGTSWAESTTNWKMILSSDGLVLPYQFGFGTSSTDFSLFQLPILYGPAVHVVSLSIALKPASSVLSLLTSPDFAKMCAGSSVNRPFQSGYGVLYFTVTVLPPSEPSTESIWSYPVESAMLMSLSCPFRTRQVRSKSSALIGEPSSHLALGLSL